MLNILQHNFFEEATAAGTGEILDNNLCTDLTIAVSGTPAGLDATVYGKLGDSWYSLGLVNLSDMTVTNKIEGAGLFAVGGVTGVEQIKVVITAIASGKVTIIGRLM